MHAGLAGRAAVCRSRCEANGLNVEVHGGGVGDLHVLGAMYLPGLYYERGLLHPFIDYDIPQPWLNTLVDSMDDEGFVHISPEPGLGYDINWDYVNSHKVD
jgi:L-alanine-DL-glutamate epimerase-like enolase superfamily enzyme